MKGNTLVLRFKVRREVRIGLVGKRKGHTVAKTAVRRYKKGQHGVLRMKLNPKRWPTKLAFRIKEPGQDSGDGSILTGGENDPSATTRVAAPAVAATTKRSRAATGR